MLLQLDVAHLETSLLNLDAPLNAAQIITIYKKKIKKQQKENIKRENKGKKIKTNCKR